MALIQIDPSELQLRRSPPSPPYPTLAKAARVQGTVLLRLTLDAMGKPEKVEAVDGPILLRPTAEAFLRKWLFEPVLREGKPVRAQCNLPVPFDLVEASGSEAGPEIHDVVLQVEDLSSAQSRSGAQETTTREAKVFLDSNGFHLVEPDQADPDRALHLKLRVQNVLGKDGISICNIQARCSRLRDFTLTENKPGQPQRMWSLHRIVGRKAEGGADEPFIQALQGILEDLRTPHALQVPRIMASQPPGIASDPRAPGNIEYRQTKIKKQPPRPPYPAVAKAMGIQGTVALATQQETPRLCRGGSRCLT